MAAISVSGLVVLIGKTYIGIGIAILYSSLCSVFLLMSRMSNYRKVRAKGGTVLFSALAGSLLFLLLFYKLSGNNNKAVFSTLTGYMEIYETILLMYLLCIIIISGISFCFNLKSTQK
jgi:predicted membrane protein